MLSGRLNSGRRSNSDISDMPTNSEYDTQLNSEIPLLTYGEEVYFELSLCRVFTFLNVHRCNTPVPIIPINIGVYSL
jgi:hypothetical protein